MTKIINILIGLILTITGIVFLTSSVSDIQLGFGILFTLTGVNKIVNA